MKIMRVLVTRQGEVEGPIWSEVDDGFGRDCSILMMAAIVAVVDDLYDVMQGSGKWFGLRRRSLADMSDRD